MAEYDPNEFFKAERKMTNADRIRSLSDEELAAWIARVEWEAGLKQRPLTEYAMRMEWLEWLQQEVAE